MTSWAGRLRPGHVALSLEDLLRTDSPGYAIKVHKSAAESDVYVACGDITDVSVP
jgi:hypothetical protein